MHRIGLRFLKWDAIAVAGVALFAVLVFLLFLPKGDQPAARAEIYQNGKLMKTVRLTADQEFTLTGKYNTTIAVRDGKIGIICSDCPGEDCVRSGWLDSTGRSIVCLPGGLEIRVVGEDSDVDYVVG